MAGLGLAGLDRRGLQQVSGDGLEIGVAQVLQTVLDRLGHGASGLGLALDMPGAQVRDELVARPGANTADLVRGDVGGIPTAQRSAGQRLATVSRHQQVARGVTGIAVSQAVDQVVATVDLGRLGRVRCEAPRAVEQGVPADHRGTDTEREVQRGFPVRRIDRLHFMHEVIVERGDVAVGHLRIGGVRHCRVQAGAIRRDAIPYGAGELLGGVVADTRGFRRCDVGREEGAHRRAERVATGKRLPARRGVTRHTVGGYSQALAGGRGAVE